MISYVTDKGRYPPCTLSEREELGYYRTLIVRQSASPGARKASMTKIEQLIAAVKLAHPERTEDEILADLLQRGMVHRGYVIDESIELESNEGKPLPARLVKKWVVLKDGRPEFRADTEQEAIEYRDRWIRNEEVEEGGEG
jgi:hypothetical protein